MKESRLIAAILSIIFSLCVGGYSYYAYIGKALTEKDIQFQIVKVGGAVSLCMLLAGIIGIVCIKYKYVIMCCSFFYIAAILLIVLIDCKELYIWCVPNLIFLGIFVCTGLWQKKKKLD